MDNGRLDGDEEGRFVGDWDGLFEGRKEGCSAAYNGAKSNRTLIINIKAIMEILWKLKFSRGGRLREIMIVWCRCGLFNLLDSDRDRNNELEHKLVCSVGIFLCVNMELRCEVTVTSLIWFASNGWYFDNLRWFMKLEHWFFRTISCPWWGTGRDIPLL
jgi:hypothetical protein